MQKTKYKSKNKVNLICSENNKILEAELLSYTPAYMLTCIVDRKIRINMRYNTAKKQYVGTVGKLEFLCDGLK